MQRIFIANHSVKIRAQIKSTFSEKDRMYMAFKKPTLPNLLRAQQRVGLDSDFEFYHPWRDYLELVINLSYKKSGVWR